MPQRSKTFKVKRCILYFVLSASLLLFGCDDNEIDPLSDYGQLIGTTNEVTTINASFKVSVLNGGPGAIPIEYGTKIKVSSNVPELRFWNDNDNSPIFVFANPRIPDCWTPRAYGNSSAAWRVTFGPTISEYPLNNRMETQSDYNGWYIAGVGNVSSLWLKVEKYDQTIDAYTSASPWLEVIFVPVPVDDPPVYKEG